MDERSLALTGCLFIESVAGSSYAFSVYSPQLKAELNYTQADIEGVGSTGNVGLYGAFAAGLAFDAAGPIAAALAGAAMSALGYVLLWSAATGRTPSPVSAVSLYTFIWSHGSAWLDTTAIATTARNFPHDRGLALGVSKSLFGLSASVLTLIYSNVYKPDVNTYLLFSGLFITGVSGLGSLVLRLVAPSDAPPMSRGAKVKLSISFFSIISLALYLAVMSALQAHNVVGQSIYCVLPLVPLLSMHFVQLLPSAWFSNMCCGSAVAEDGTAEGDESLSLVKRGGEDSVRDGLLLPADTAVSATFSRKGMSVFETAFHLDFLLFLILLFCGSGAGITLINNVGNLTQSLGGAADSQDVYVVIISIFNCLGRLIMGASSDVFSRYISRPGFFTLCVASMAGAMTLCTFADLNTLYAAVAWTGFSYGAYWSLGPAFLAERFGTGSFASINALSSVVTALASYGFSAVMAANIYQSHIPVGGGTVCYGSDCYRLTFIVLALVNAGAACLGLYLTCSLRGMYRAPHGKAIPFEDIDVEHPPHGCTQVLQAALLRVCCCGAGRWLLTGYSDAEACANYMEARTRARSASVTGRSKSVDIMYSTINA